ncbi:MAG: cytochrome c [Gammaproteobacteria bacterium]|jgi:cytochrome c556|nr:hypothetical protein [Chromatiales bacterium]MCP4927183.1 cytochrome c [Gammaproteobacteria bacterium]MDP7153414.1 cytochrome c [Gammaproteobacteria bacterium]MDP7296083.1 cytochrome c [Gammaproteobacteria bacterium]MDP7419081.1 cytochrome c [Gammaproteobacteria bacterium]
MNRRIITVSLLIFLSATGAEELGNEAAINKRQTAFKAMDNEVEIIEEALDAGKSADNEAIRKAAEQIILHSKSLTGTFVTDSYRGKTKAKKKIWSKWADFTERQQTLITSAEYLLQASKTGNSEDLETAFEALTDNCSGCHRRYKQIF